MKDMIFRFTVLVVILILFNMTHLGGNQKDQEITELYQLGHPATSSHAHKILTLNPISFMENYEYLFKEEGRMKEPPEESKESLEETQTEVKTVQTNETDPEKTEEKEEPENEKKKKISLTDIICRAIVGHEQSAASSLDRKQGLFVDLYLNFPILEDDKQDNWLKSKFSFWSNIKLTSTPLNVESNIEELATGGGFVSQLKEVKINQVAQAVEFQGGLEYRISRNSENKNHSFNFILGINATTPISVKEAIEIFEISDDIKTQYPNEDYTGKEYVALVPPSRDKFFRQYYLGFRLKSNITRREKKEENKITQTGSSFPATLDIVYGWKDRGTHGPLKGFFKSEFFIPLRLGNILNVYFFGSIIFKTSKTKLSDHLFLKSAPEEITYPAANILRITTPEINRDFYRVGIGIDVFSIF